MICPLFHIKYSWHCLTFRTGPASDTLRISPRMLLLYSRYGLHHGQAHHDGGGSMVLPVVWQPTDTVVAVPQDLDPQLVIFLKGA